MSSRRVPRGPIACLIVLILSSALSSGADAQSRPAFDAGNPATYPRGMRGCAAACSSGTIELPVPPDGVLRFSRFVADGAFTITFAPNTTNTAVTLDVSGDVLLRSAACCGTLSVSGSAGTPGTAAGPGAPGNGGPGGFRGGAGHGQPLQNLTPGGNGLGPGGGFGSSTSVEASGGTYVPAPEGAPVIGGSGGGGGSGYQSGADCTGGGGGGGGGALIVRAGGRMTVGNFAMTADGGNGGEPGNRTCAQGAAGGSGGIIEISAASLVTQGTARVTARGGDPGFRGESGTAGRIRLESGDDTANTAFETVPGALRVVRRTQAEGTGGRLRR